MFDGWANGFVDGRVSSVGVLGCSIFGGGGGPFFGITKYLESVFRGNGCIISTSLGVNRLPQHNWYKSCIIFVEKSSLDK